MSRVCVDIKGYFFSSLLTGVITLCVLKKPSTRLRGPTSIVLLRKIKLVFKVFYFHFSKHSTISKGSNVFKWLMANTWHHNVLNLHLLSRTDITHKLQGAETATYKVPAVWKPVACINRRLKNLERWVFSFITRNIFVTRPYRKWVLLQTVE